MEPELVKVLGSLGVGGLVAGLIFLAYRKDSQAWQAGWKGQSEMLIMIVKDNTKTQTELVELVRELIRQFKGKD